MTDRPYETPEGFTLWKPLLMPEVRTFDEVLTYVRPWDFGTMSHRNGHAQDETPALEEFDGNYLTGFCSTSGHCPAWSRPHMQVEPTDATRDVLRGQLVTMGDHMAFKVIYHQSNDRCLVLIDHNQIIGSRWLAYIDPTSVPAEKEHDHA